MRSYLNIIGFKKILVGFVIVILIAFFNAIFSSSVVRQNKKIILQITKVINPYVETLDQFNLLVTRSKMLTTNWVYLQHNETDKKSLVELHSNEYPRLKTLITRYVNQLGTQADIDTMNTVFSSFEALIVTEQAVMEELTSFEDYETPLKKFRAEEILESKVIPASDILIQKLSAIVKAKHAQADQMKDRMLASFNKLIWTVLTIVVGLLALVLLAGFYISRSIKKPVTKMNKIILRLARGELPNENLKVTEDVIGEMVAAVNILRNSFTKTATFANQIGQGNLNAEFTPLSESDMLGNALVGMRKSLKTYSEEMEQKVTERTQQVVEKNKQLQAAYTEIRDSIAYAKRIQEAISPSVDLIYKTFKQSFILYRPKDIVSGDFYWFAQKGDEYIIAVVDCTGHGVPGALMTVIGNSLLNQIVNLIGIYQPAEILNQLDRKVKETLQQHGVGSETNDGMDVALCTYNKERNTLSFAGAKRSLFLFRNGEYQEIRGDKFPIGSFQYNFQKIFTSHHINLLKGDTIYIFSDGYADQFGMNGRKFLKKSFLELLGKLQPMSMDDQLLNIEFELDKWKGRVHQTDDILVIGIRF